MTSIPSSPTSFIVHITRRAHMLFKCFASHQPLMVCFLVSACNTTQSTFSARCLDSYGQCATRRSCQLSGYTPRTPIATITTRASGSIPMKWLICTIPLFRCQRLQASADRWYTFRWRRIGTKLSYVPLVDRLQTSMLRNRYNQQPSVEL